MELIDRDLQMLLVQVEFTLEPLFYCNMCCVQLSIVNIIIYLLVS